LSQRFARAGVAADAARVAAIYNEGIEDRVATYQTSLRGEADILAWIEGNYPLLVAGEERVMAFAVAQPYRAAPYYEGVREFSVYVARDGRGAGYGKLVLAALFDAVRARGWWKLVSRVFPENMASRKLLSGLGFREVGVYEKHARLDGVWRDVVIVEKLLI
jgi:phosphinothricin acetyltransferase